MTAIRRAIASPRNQLGTATMLLHEHEEPDYGWGIDHRRVSEALELSAVGAFASKSVAGAHGQAAFGSLKDATFFWVSPVEDLMTVAPQRYLGIVRDLGWLNQPRLDESLRPAER